MARNNTYDGQGNRQHHRDRNEEIAEFSTVPFQQRTFLLGVSPKQKEFEELTKTAKWSRKRPVYHAGVNKTVYFAETKSGFMAKHVHESAGDFRVITVWDDPESAPCWAILTNRKSEDSEKTLEMYMLQWPYLEEASDGELVLTIPQNLKEQKEREEKKENVGIFIDFVETLGQHSQRHFFPPAYAKNDVSHLITSIYDISGSYCETNTYLKVFLEAEKDSVYRKDLQYAVKKVNERHILDYSGRKLWIEI